MSGSEMFGKKMLRAFSDVQALSTKVCARHSACAWASLMSTKAVCFEIKRRLLFASRAPCQTSFSVIPITVTNGSRYCAMFAGSNAVLVVMLGDLCLLVWVTRGVSTSATKDLATRMDKANARSLEPRFAMAQVYTNYSDICA